MTAAELLLRELPEVEARTFVWMPDLGMGHFPVDPSRAPYDREYFDRYLAYEGTELGQRLNRFRVDLVNRFVGSAPVLDVGIGCGTFITLRGGETFGCDVNPAALSWLNQRGLSRHPIESGIRNACFWDSLEHLPDPGAYVSGRDFVFVSVPIFMNLGHVRNSKHYRPEEHVWYWTRDGLVAWFARRGFEVVHECDTETQLGREDIGTFVFHRGGNGGGAA